VTTRNLGNLVVRLALELAQYKAEWKDAEQATRDGVAKVDQHTQNAAKASDLLKGKLREQTGAYGDAAASATEYARTTALSMGATTALATAAAAGTAAIAGMAYAAYQGAQEHRKLNDELLLTGNYAGLVSGQLDKMAMSVASSIGGSVGSAREVLAGLAATGRFTVDSLQEVGSAVQLVARFSGQTNAQVLKDFAGMADGVAKWAAKHNEAYHFLDIDTYRYIKRLEEQGEKQDAMRATSEALSKHLGGDLRTNLGYIERAWLAIGNAASGAWAAMKSVGKPEGTQEIFAKSSEYLRRAASTYRPEDPRFQALQANNFGLFRQTEREQRAAGDRTAIAQATEKAIAADTEWDKITGSLLTKTERMNKELERARELAAQRGSTAGELADVEARIREKFKERGGTGGKSEGEKDAERQRRLLSELMGVQASYMQQLSDLDALRQRGNISEERYVELVNELIARQPMAKKLLEEQNKETERQAKALAAAAKAHEAEVKEVASHIDRLEEENEKLALQNQTLGMTKSAIAEVTAARLEEQAAALEMIAIRKWEKDLDDGLYDMRRREAQQLRDRARLTREGAAKQEAIDAAQAAAKEWERTGQVVEDALGEGLRAAMRKGEGFFKAFMKSIEQSAATVTLRFGSQFVGGALGFGNAAAGNGGAPAAGAMSAGSNFANALGLAGVGSTFAGGLSAGFGGLTGSIGSLFGIAGTGTTLGGSISAGMTALGAGNIAGGLGTLVGALGPIALGVGLLVSYISKRGETRHGGQYSGLDFISGPSGGEINADATRQAIGGTMSTINQLLAGLGSETRLYTFSSGFESSKNGKGFAYAGGQLSSGAYFGQGYDGQGYMNRRGSKSEEQAAAEAAEEFVQATLQALQADLDNLPEWVGKYLRGIDVDAMGRDAAQALLAQINAVMTERAALEERLFQASATEEEKRNRELDRERKTVHEGNRELLERVHLLEDEKRAAAAAADDLRERTQKLDEQIAEGRNRLQEAYNREASAQREVMNRYQGYVDRLKSFAQQLSTGSFAMLTVEDQYRADARRFADVDARARAGDEEAIAQLVEVQEQFLRSSMALNGSNQKYFADLDAVKRSNDAVRLVASAHVDVARLQLNALQELARGWIQVDRSVLSVRDAINELVKLQLEKAAITPGSGLNRVPVIGGGGLTTIVPDVPAATGGFQYAGRDLMERINDYALAGTSSHDIVRGLIQSGVTAERVMAAYLETHGQGMSGGMAQDLVDTYRFVNEQLAANSHASGLDEVPYDDYIARLHKKERVQTAAQAAAADATPKLLEIMISETRAVNGKLTALLAVTGEGHGKVAQNTALMAEALGDVGHLVLLARGMPAGERA